MFATFYKKDFLQIPKRLTNKPRFTYNYIIYEIIPCTARFLEFNKPYFKHVGGLLPPLRNMFRLVEHALSLVGLVQVSDELRLQIVLYIIH